MSLPIRLAAAAILLLLIGGFLYAISTPDEIAAHQPRRFSSSEQCRACHEEVYLEWQGSHHQIAYENPEVRKLSDDFRNKECQACHLPRPISETGLLNRTLPRITRPEEGVDCLTCHLDALGRVVGNHASDRGCTPVVDVEMMSVKACQTCHNQHNTTDQYLASRYPGEGVTCNDCHMPKVPRASGGEGRRHVYEGCHDEEMLRRAATFELRRDGDEAVVTTTNTGAGHNFPTEERHRAVDVLVRFLDATGAAGEWQPLFRFRQPYRDEPGENTQLPADEAHVDRVTIPDGTTRVEARLWYRLNPYAVDGDDASTLLFERTLELP